jgi:hypothetical protein
MRFAARLDDALWRHSLSFDWVFVMANTVTGCQQCSGSGHSAQTLVSDCPRRSTRFERLSIATIHQVCAAVNNTSDVNSICPFSRFLFGL